MELTSESMRAGSAITDQKGRCSVLLGGGSRTGQELTTHPLVRTSQILLACFATTHASPFSEFRKISDLSLMDFFKSVFSDEPEPESRSPSAESESESESESVRTDPTSSSNQPDPNPTEAVGGGGAWNFGGLFRTLTASSGSVIETYRRDLQEFRSELRKEIQVAQGSLENVGQAIDELGSSVFKGTAQFIAQGKDAILAIENESDSSDTNAANSSQRDLGSKRYSRFEAQVRVIQSNPATYSEEADDVEDYRKWKSEFVMESREEIEQLLAENGAMESVYTKLVPGSVDEETFWCRYFHKVHKLKQAEELRANLVKRAISSEEDDLSWDVEEEEERNDREEKEEKEEVKGNVDSGGRNPATVAQGAEVIEGSSQNVKNHEGEEMGKSKDGQIGDVKEEEGLKGTEKSGDGGNAAAEKVDMEKSEGEGDVVSKSDEKASVEEKGDNGGSSKDSDFSVVSSRATSQDQEEEDFGWDEIEDLSCIDEKKVSHGGASLSKVDLHKRLSAAEEEEDLSWD